MHSSQQFTESLAICSKKYFQNGTRDLFAEIQERVSDSVSQRFGPNDTHLLCFECTSPPEDSEREKVVSIDRNKVPPNKQ